MKAIDLTNRRVLIRCDRAGVHFGTLIQQNGREVHLKNARRLWNWKNALALYDVASKGIDLKNSKIDGPVDESVLLDVIEIIPIMKESNLPC